MHDRTIEFIETFNDHGTVMDRSLETQAQIRKNVVIAGGITANILSSTPFVVFYM